MSIGKKLRFDVFKRDSFTCQYCGNHPPEVILEVDHIKPKSKDGNDDINNLITSCFDCNRGKSNIELSDVPNTILKNKELIEEKESQYIEYHKLLAKIDKRINGDINKVDEVYTRYFPKWSLSHGFKKTTLKSFLSRLGVNECVDSMEKACYKFENSRKQYDEYENRWLSPEDLAIKYFCGICWNKIKSNSHGCV